MTTTDQSAPARSRSVALAAGVSCALAIWWIVTLELRKNWGWDESMHAELPAVRMLLHLAQGDGGGFARVLHSCVQYPFGWPLVLTALQTIFGVSEFVCRAAGLVAWALVGFGSFLLAREVLDSLGEEARAAFPGKQLFPWLALIFCALSPLGLGYGQSLFLEVPFACCAVFALRAWLRRSTRRAEPKWWWRELAAGIWLAAAFFVKFNYGLLLIFGCGLDALVGLVIAWRAGRLRREALRLSCALAPLVLALAWWLLWPIPFGAEMGAHHRDALFAFLGSNQSMAATPFEQRVIFWTVYLVYTARLFLVQILGALAGLRFALRPGPRLLWFVFLGSGLPIWTHNFHLDRFLIPGAPLFWVLAALGLASLVPAAQTKRLALLVPVALAVLLFPSLDGPWVARRLGLLAGDEASRAYITDILAHKHELGPARRFWTPGLPPATTGAILEIVNGVVGETQRVGWIGNSSEISPAALHLSLLQASGNRARFLADANLPLDVTFTGSDPNWSAAELAEFVAPFDVMISTNPPDLLGRGSRTFIGRYSVMLVDELGWIPERVGEVTIARDPSPPLAVSIYALRPPE